MTSTTIALAVIYGIIMLCFGVAFLIDWIRCRERIRAYSKYGVWAGVVVVVLDLLVVAFTPSAWTPMLIAGLAAEGIVFIRIFGFTMLGMHYCALLGNPSFPLLLRRFRVQRPSDANLLPPSTESDLEAAIESADVQQQRSAWIEIPAPEDPFLRVGTEHVPVPLRTITRTGYVVSTLGVAAVSVLYSVVLFVLTKPHVSQIMRTALGKASLEAENSFTLQFIPFALVFAVAEEMVFRLGIQSYLARHMRLQGGRYWIAIAITTTLWTLGHAGVLVPEWVKLVQVFPVGIMLGWLFKKYGVESSIIAHGLFNLVLMLTSTNLLK